MMHARTLQLKKSAAAMAWHERKSVKFAMVIAGLCLGVLYVVQINLTATKGYEIRELERKLSSLRQESQVLRLQSLELQSLDRLENQLSESEANFVAARPDGFVSATGTAVAAR